MEGLHTSPQGPKFEKSVLTDEEIVTAGLGRLGGDALTLYTALNSPIPNTETSPSELIDSFNALPASERSQGVYDSGQPLTERKTVERALQTPHGFLYAVQVAPDGEITLSSRIG
jgi:hypothetical protein